MFGPVLQHIGESGSWGGWTPSKICKATVVRYPVGSRFGYISDGKIPVDRRNERKPVVVAVRKCKIFGVKNRTLQSRSLVHFSDEIGSEVRGSLQNLPPNGRHFINKCDKFQGGWTFEVDRVS